jgi:cytochrome c-type biogenesis protein CcmF
MAGAITDVVERTGLFRQPAIVVRARAFGLPRSAWGTAVAHFGIALTMLGIVGAGTWGTERIVAVKPGQVVSLSGYDLTFDGLTQLPGPNYTSLIANFTVREGGAIVGTMRPSKRSFSARAMTVNEAALMALRGGQLYMSLGDAEADGSLAIRLYYKPLVLLIWIGAVIMFCGGGLSLSDRRLRVGAPKPAAKPALQPAE